MNDCRHCLGYRLCYLYFVRDNLLAYYKEALIVDCLSLSNSKLRSHFAQSNGAVY